MAKQQQEYHKIQSAIQKDMKDEEAKCQEKDQLPAHAVPMTEPSALSPGAEVEQTSLPDAPAEHNREPCDNINTASVQEAVIDKPCAIISRS